MRTYGAEWHALVNSLNGKPTFGYFLSFSSRRLRLPLYAIKGEARMSLNATIFVGSTFNF